MSERNCCEPGEEIAGAFSDLISSAGVYRGLWHSGSGPASAAEAPEAAQAGELLHHPPSLLDAEAVVRCR